MVLSWIVMMLLISKLILLHVHVQYLYMSCTCTWHTLIRKVFLRKEQYHVFKLLLFTHFTCTCILRKGVADQQYIMWLSHDKLVLILGLNITRFRTYGHIHIQVPLVIIYNHVYQTSFLLLTMIMCLFLY